MTYGPPDPRVARLIAEEVLRRQGEFRANSSYLHAMFCREIPDSPAAGSLSAATRYLMRARPDLGAFGIAVRRHASGPGRREWAFRLVAVPGETGPDAA
ncbi:hypothetical protein AB0873_16695 [Micromonospora sp. NPDC047707]|uniref:hypothetical protein n=1 Tax=Micromonospora sp. NPDC047707 TaxID=3154498 RepID=UPI00345381BF